MLNTCGLAKNQNQGISYPNYPEQPSFLQKSPSAPCSNFQRLLNPDVEPKPSETNIERYFRFAFNAATEGKFEEAIAYYQKASEIATCECDKKHTLAGTQAAQEAKNLLSQYGMGSKPTQFFWGRLQELTRLLPCVQILK